MHSAGGALIVANNLRESEIAELKKAVSNARMWGRFQASSG